MEKHALTEQETLFCQLYANGEVPYVGNLSKSYQAAFGECESPLSKARELLKRKHIQDFLNELCEEGFDETKYIKKFIASNLMHIAQECAELEVYDKRGRLISPAAARSVAVNSLKALMDIYPVKEVQVNKLNIEGAGEGGVVFNVIVPERSKDQAQ